jgi:hypothetical protein
LRARSRERGEERVDLPVPLRQGGKRLWKFRPDGGPPWRVGVEGSWAASPRPPVLASAAPPRAANAKRLAG